jgi:hypothetical protein
VEEKGNKKAVVKEGNSNGFILKVRLQSLALIGGRVVKALK